MFRLDRQDSTISLKFFVHMNNLNACFLDDTIPTTNNIPNMPKNISKNIAANRVK